MRIDIALAHRARHSDGFAQEYLGVAMRVRPSHGARPTYRHGSPGATIGMYY